MALHVPITPGVHVQWFKQSRRRDDDIAIVNACYAASVGKDGNGTAGRLRFFFFLSKLSLSVNFFFFFLFCTHICCHLVRTFGSGFGGLAAVTRSMPELEAALVGQTWSPALIDKAHAVLAVSGETSAATLASDLAHDENASH